VNPALLGTLTILILLYRVAGWLSSAATRQREARALLDILLQDISTGRRNLDDPGVRDGLAWCGTRVGPGPPAAAEHRLAALLDPMPVPVAPLEPETRPIRTAPAGT
jgi:hypothetical protein